MASRCQPLLGQMSLSCSILVAKASLASFPRFMVIDNNNSVSKPASSPYRLPRHGPSKVHHVSRGAEGCHRRSALGFTWLGYIFLEGGNMHEWMGNAGRCRGIYLKMTFGGSLSVDRIWRIPATSRFQTPS